MHFSGSTKWVLGNFARMPYTLYVNERDREVLTRKKFREAHPDHRPDKRCVYVGMTSKTPEQRLDANLRSIIVGKMPILGHSST